MAEIAGLKKLFTKKIIFLKEKCYFYILHGNVVSPILMKTLPNSLSICVLSQFYNILFLQKFFNIFSCGFRGKQGRRFLSLVTLFLGLSLCLRLLIIVGDTLLLSKENDLQTSTYKPVETLMIKLQPGLSIINYQEIPVFN